MMDLNNIHWHDCVIISSIELPEKDCFVMNVEYPVDWNANEFSKYSIVFNNVTSLVIDEIPFDGCPTILSASTIETSNSNELRIVKIETNAGYREVTAKSVTLIPLTQLFSF